jgi:hypothetical protein
MKSLLILIALVVSIAGGPAFAVFLLMGAAMYCRG